ncbi:MAG: TolC family protein, partial [Beijerinckiaceae bacterium]|nr:TolC family protein [Beijerinckiaceae bacterium]
LTASRGSSAASLANLFVPATAFYALGGNVSQTIFDAGTLFHKQKQAEAEFDQAYAQYRSTVIDAFQNVADALRAIEADARAEKAAQTSEAAALKSLGVVRKQLELGQVSTIILLNAQQTYAQAALTLVQAKASRYSDTAALFQALGGGWWNRPPPQGETW